MAAKQNIEMTRGQDLVIQFSMSPPTSVSGWTITFQVKDSLGGTSRITKTVGSGITVASTPKGVLQVALSASDTSALTAQSYVWDLRRTNSGSNRELARGELRLAAGVTE